MLGFPARGMSDSETGTTPPLGFQHTHADVRTPCKQSDGFSSSSRRLTNRTEGYLHHSSYRMSSLMVHLGDWTPAPSADATMPPTVHYDMSTSYALSNPNFWHQSQGVRSMCYGNIQDAGQSGYAPSSVGSQPLTAQEVQPVGAATYPPVVIDHATAQGEVDILHPAPVFSPTIPFSQKHPFAFQTQVPVSASSLPREHQSQNARYSEQSSYQRPDQRQGASNERGMEDFYTRLQKMHAYRSEAFDLVPRMEGELYKRRSKHLPDRKVIIEPLRIGDRTPTFSCLPKNTSLATICPCNRTRGSTPFSVHQNTHPANLPETKCSARSSTFYSIGSQCLGCTSLPSAHIRTPRNAVDASPSSRFVRDYIACLRNLLAKGWPEDIVLGPTRIDTDRLFMDSVPETVLLALSQWVAHVISTFEVLGVPEKLGLMVLYCRYFKVCLNLLGVVVLAN